MFVSVQQKEIFKCLGFDIEVKTFKEFMAIRVIWRNKPHPYFAENMAERLNNIRVDDKTKV